LAAVMIAGLVGRRATRGKQKTCKDILIKRCLKGQGGERWIPGVEKRRGVGINTPAQLAVSILKRLDIAGRVF